MDPSDAALGALIVLAVVNKPWGSHAMHPPTHPVPRSPMNQPLAREQVQTEERLQAIAKVFDEHEAYAGGFGCSCQPEDTHPNAFPGAKVMLDEVWERHIARAILVRLDRLGLIR